MRISNKIVKGIKSLEKEEKIIIKTLSYVSQINKNQKEMRKLFKQLMKNLKISFIEEESTIKYEEYYFNGIPLPKDIEFKDKGTNSFKVLWKLDNINVLNIDKNEIKYRIEIRKENTNDEFIQVYEGKENNYIINKLEKNTNYEIKICSVYKDTISEWSEIHKIKTSNIDSIIINESERGNEFLQHYMNGQGIIRWNYYIEEQEMALALMYFMKNVIIKDQQYVYVKMKKIIYSEDFLLFHGHLTAVGVVQMIVFYLL